MSGSISPSIPFMAGAIPADSTNDANTQASASPPVSSSSPASGPLYTGVGMRTAAHIPSLAAYATHGAYMYLSPDEIKQMGQALLDAEPDQEYVQSVGTTPLIPAARDNKLGMVRALLEVGFDPDEARLDGVTPLSTAAQNGHVEVVRLLLNNNADPNSRDTEGWTPLHWAAYGGHLRMVELLLGNKAEPNSRDTGGMTPLHWAAHGGHLRMVELLLGNKAELSLKCDDGRTALHFAVINGHWQIVKLLLDKGVDPNPPCTSFRVTALFLAVQNGHWPTVKLLLDKGGDPNLPAGDGRTPLYIAAQTSHQEIVELLLDNGADPNLGDDDGKTPLHEAAEGDQLEVADLLLRKNANPNARDNDGRTPLHKAAEGDQLEVADLLLRKGARLNEKTSDGRRPMHLAAEEGHLEMVRLLLDKGGNLNDRTNDRRTPLHFAAGNDHSGMVDFMIETVKKSGWEGRETKRLKKFLNAQDENGYSPLVFACHAKSLSAEIILREGGINNLVLPKDDVYKNRLLSIMATKVVAVKLNIAATRDANKREKNEKLLLQIRKMLQELMEKMQKISPGVSLEERIQEALEKQEWNLVCALHPLITNDMIKPYHMKMLDIAWNPTSPQTSQADSLLLSKDERSRLMKMVGEAYLEEDFGEEILTALLEPDQEPITAEDPEILRRSKQAIAALMLGSSEDGFAILEGYHNEGYEKNPKLKVLYERLQAMPKKVREDLHEFIRDMSSPEDVDSAPEDVDSEDVDSEDVDLEKNKVNPLLLENRDGTINQDAWERRLQSQKDWLERLRADDQTPE